MTDHRRRSMEFTAKVGRDGTIAVPEETLRQVQSGEKVHVRLSPIHLNAQLRERGVTEEEVDRISAAQLESRDQVVKFLLSEGSLGPDKAFRRRAEKSGGRTRV